MKLGDVYDLDSNEIMVRGRILLLDNTESTKDAGRTIVTIFTDILSTWIRLMNFAAKWTPMNSKSSDTESSDKKTLSALQLPTLPRFLERKYRRNLFDSDPALALFGVWTILVCGLVLG